MENGQGSVSEKELWILHVMLYGLKEQFDESRVCTGAFKARWLMYHAIASTGGIAVGGLITLLVEYFKIDTTVHEADDPRDAIDLTLLTNSGMLKREETDYYLCQRDKHEPKRLLPLSPHEQTVTDSRN
ncbi:hypothetical protein Droror1_Dr00027956 [Drosera rotundifolia]